MAQELESALQIAAAFVLGVAEKGQRAMAAFKVRGGHVVENQRAVREVALGKCGLDAVLPRQQPIHGAIELGFVDGFIQAQKRTQRGGGGLLLEGAGIGEFGGRLNNARDDHGDDKVALGAGGAGEDRLQFEPAESAECGGDVTVRKRALNQDSAGSVHEGFSLQNAAQGIDLGFGPIGEILEGSLDDFAVLAEALAQEDGGGRVAVGDGIHVHGYSI